MPTRTNAVPPERLVVRYETDIHWDIDGMALPAAAEWFLEKEKVIRELHPDTQVVRVSFDPMPRDEGYGLYIKAYAPENEKEEKKRLEKEAENKAQKDAYDRREFERLSRKFA